MDKMTPIGKEMCPNCLKTHAQILAKALRHEQERVKGLIDACIGLSQGTDWNNGTHAKIYREKLLKELKKYQSEENK